MSGAASEISPKISKRGGKRPNSGGKRPGAGRPPGAKNKVTPDERAKFVELAKSMVPECFKVLQEIMQDRTLPAAARVSAVSLIVDRGLGKAPQHIEHTGKNGGPIEHRQLSPESQSLLDEVLTGLGTPPGAKPNGATKH